MYSDPSHGWLKVPTKELDILGIRRQISQYSFIGKEYSYLEEDLDMGIFIKAHEKSANKKWNWNEIKQLFSNNYTHIRNFDHFQ